MGILLSGRGTSRVASGVTVKGLPMSDSIFEAGLGVQMENGPRYQRDPRVVFEIETGFYNPTASDGASKSNKRNVT